MPRIKITETSRSHKISEDNSIDDGKLPDYLQYEIALGVFNKTINSSETKPWTNSLTDDSTKLDEAKEPPPNASAETELEECLPLNLCLREEVPQQKAPSEVSLTDQEGEDPYGNSLSEELDPRSASQKREREFVTCTLCDKYLRRGSLREHMDRHTGEGKFPCDMCGKTFSRASALEKHRLTHTGEKPFSCVICNKMYRQKVHLNEHMRSHTGERPYPCPVCGFSLASKSLLNRHIRTHSDTRSFTCDLCDKTFKRREGLLAHCSTHETEKRFVCSQCDRAFATPRALKCHQVVHSDERPYACSHELCDKAFKTAKLLRNHVATHTGRRPFQCTRCGKRFRMKNYLDNHMQVHFNNRYFHCSGCQRRFHHKSSLEKHMRRVHGAVVDFTVSFEGEEDPDPEMITDPTDPEMTTDHTDPDVDNIDCEVLVSEQIIPEASIKEEV